MTTPPQLITTLTLVLTFAIATAAPANAGCFDKTATFGKGIATATYAPVKNAVDQYGKQDPVSTTTGVALSATVLTPAAIAGATTGAIFFAAAETVLSPFCLIAKAFRK